MERRELFELMEKAPIGTLKALDSKCTNLEFRLQDLWGFPRDIVYHRFWERPRCTCPKIDNEDNYPYGYYIRVLNCPLHGGE